MRALNAERLRRIRARQKRFTEEQWVSVVRAIAGSPWHTGTNSSGWVADFDYAIRSDTVMQRQIERAEAPSHARTRTRLEPSQYDEWICDHDPHCLSRYKCRQLEALEAARAEVEVSP